MSQYDPYDIAEEQIVDGEGKEDDGFPDKVYSRHHPDPQGAALTGFPADLSDAEDGRDDDVPARPKSKTTNGRRWEKELKQISTWKQDLRKVTLEAFTEFCKERHSYKDYVLELLQDGKLSALPEVVYAAQLNVTRKEESQFWFGIATTWYKNKGGGLSRLINITVRAYKKILLRGLLHRTG